MYSLKPVPGGLSRYQAAHLIRRSTYNSNPRDISDFVGKSASECLKILLKEQNPLPPPKDWKTGKVWVNPKPDKKNTFTRNLITQVKTWWLQNMMRYHLSLTDKMAFFWHTNFTTRQKKVNDATALYYQLRLFYHHALGNVKDLTRDICYDNAMLLFLDNTMNRRGNINENFARELLELYTIGKGKEVGPGNYTNYTEQDVREGAKVLSGIIAEKNYTHKNKAGIATGKIALNNKGQAYHHDPGSKFFSPAFNSQVIEPKETKQGLTTEAGFKEELDKFLDMIFSQKETARNFCRKLYRFFVYHEISQQVESEVIEPLANTLYQNNYQIKPVLDQLLQSQHFFGADEPGQKVNGSLIKSPLELTLGAISQFGLSVPTPGKDLKHYYHTIFEFGLMEHLNYQGMDLYEPESTAGYPAYFQQPGFNRNWISPNRLNYRYLLPDRLFKGKSIHGRPIGMQLDILAFVNDSSLFTNPADAPQLMTELSFILFPFELPRERFDYFLHQVLLEELSYKTWEMEWKQFKKTGDGSGIGRQLKKLALSMMQSPEYQLF